jgi:hypothetical protein
MMRFSAWMRLIVYQIGSNPNNSGRKHDQTGNFLSKKRSKSRISAYQLNGYHFHKIILQQFIFFACHSARYHLSEYRLLPPDNRYIHPGI